jgi:transcriptional regulator with XRE-family HTH domain
LKNITKEGARLEFLKDKKISWNEKIKILRTLNKWSQSEAAKKCGTTQKVYWLWEAGKVYPRGTSRKAIAYAFNISPDIIFDELIS